MSIIFLKILITEDLVNIRHFKYKFIRTLKDT